MKILNRKYIIIISAIFLSIIIISVAYINGIFTPYIEKAINETPQAKVAEYVNAISSQNKEMALDLWKMPESGNLSQKELDELKKRREKETQELIVKKINSSFKISNIELWRTCCVPGIINDYKEAGGERIKVELTDGNGVSYEYIFDIFDKQTSYFGEAAGHPVRHWVIRDIYQKGQTPLFWTVKATESDVQFPN